MELLTEKDMGGGIIRRIEGGGETGCENMMMLSRQEGGGSESRRWGLGGEWQEMAGRGMRGDGWGQRLEWEEKGEE